MLVFQIPTPTSTPKYSRGLPTELLDNEILEVLESFGRPVRLNAIASKIDAEEPRINHRLDRLHSTGEVSKAVVYQNGCQKRASFFLWATDPAAFTGGDL